MIAAFDVHYGRNGGASAAAVLFSDYGDVKPAAVHTLLLPGAQDYIPGEFFRRELPCLMSLIERMPLLPEEMIIDGYVMLGNRPGLGRRLFEAFHERIPVIGVAKSRFKGALGMEVYRGLSLRPLYITAAGMDMEKACEKIRMMHGTHRVPTLLKRVDLLARERARGTPEVKIDAICTNINGLVSAHDLVRPPPRVKM